MIINALNGLVYGSLLFVLASGLVLVYGLRRHAQGDRPIDVTPHFVAACVLAACTTAREDLAYAAFAALVLGGVLVAARPRR